MDRRGAENMKALNFPKPSVDNTRYDNTLKEGFAKYPKRIENYEKYLASSRSEQPDYLPIKMDFENVSRCNLHCDMCQVVTFEKNKRAEDMTLDEFISMIDANIGLFEIKIQGLGEPFLHKHFVDMVKYAADKYIWVRSTTNATLLHKDDNYKRIIDAGIGELQISIDGTTKEVYEKIRKGSNFELVSENCKKINAYCDEIGSDRTRMWALLQNDNFDELYNFVKFAKELGFKRLAISMDVNGWGDESWSEKNEKKRVSDKITQEDVDALLVQAKEVGLDLSFWDISTKYTKANPCPWPFERAFVSSDKKVVPCCMIGNPDIYNFGSALEFESVWNGNGYVAFRKSHLEGRIPKMCQFCYEEEV
jgi:pyrroloquinoline quinone biosynthesis protein E